MARLPHATTAVIAAAIPTAAIPTVVPGAMISPIAAVMVIAESLSVVILKRPVLVALHRVALWRLSLIALVAVIALVVVLVCLRPCRRRPSGHDGDRQGKAQRQAQR